jgi:hypothetical protein
MKSPIKISADLNNTSIHTSLLELLKGRLDVFYEKNKELIDDYLYMKSKLEELEYRLDFQYKLTISNSKSSGKVINAKLKLPFSKNENNKSKYPYFNIHVGKLSEYKQGLRDPQVRVDAENKLKSFIDKKYPFSILNTDYQLVEFHY